MLAEARAFRRCVSQPGRCWLQPRAAFSDTISSSVFSGKPFSSIQGISVPTCVALSDDFKFDDMTRVQALAIPQALSGEDAFVRARTGSGKTIAFLVPMIERIRRYNQKYQRSKLERDILAGKLERIKRKAVERQSAGPGAAPRTAGPPTRVLIGGDLVDINEIPYMQAAPTPVGLILVPTRELGLQIAQEARKLCNYNTDMDVAVFVGGRRIDGDRRKIDYMIRGAMGFNLKEKIIVCTPGRLLEHLTDTRGFKGLCTGVKMIVVDESDRMLDMGFHKDVAEILIAIAKSQVSLEKRLLVTRKQCELQLAELSQHFGESSTESRPQLSRRAKYVLDEAEDPVKEFDHQTLLFSATVSTKVLEIANSILRPGFKYIDATEQSVIDEDRTEPLSGKDALRRAVEVAEREGAGTPGAAVDNTLIHLEQAIYCAPDLKQLEVLAYVLHKHILEHPEDYKVIVFTPTSRHAAFLCEFVLCLRDLGTNVIEIHSKMTQSKRTKASDAFRSGCGIVMFSSDVSARGMDYPDVTMVVQLGLVSRNQYTHRVGRTARVDKEGAGVLICTPYELPVVQRELSGIMSCDNVADMNTVNADASAESSALLRKVHALRDSVADALGMTGKKLYKLAEAASTSWLGFYALECNRLGWGKVDLITHGQQFCASLGLKGFPELTPRTIQALQLHGTVLGTISLKNLAVKTAPNKSTSRFVDEGFRGGGGFRGGPSRDESRWKSSSQVLNKGRTRL